jgi:hypothetical protein
MSMVIRFYSIYIYINEGIHYRELEARILCITGHGKTLSQHARIG